MVKLIVSLLLLSLSIQSTSRKLQGRCVIPEGEEYVQVYSHGIE